MPDLTFLDPCPDSVWHLLPGGPEAWNDGFAEGWQSSTVASGRCRDHG
jgi:hypothetical protein